MRGELCPARRRNGVVGRSASRNVDWGRDTLNKKKTQHIAESCVVANKGIEPFFDA